MRAKPGGAIRSKLDRLVQAAGSPGGVRRRRPLRPVPPNREALGGWNDAALPRVFVSIARFPRAMDGAMSGYHPTAAPSPRLESDAPRNSPRSRSW